MAWLRVVWPQSERYARSREVWCVPLEIGLRKARPVVVHPVGSRQSGLTANFGDRFRSLVSEVRSDNRVQRHIAAAGVDYKSHGRLFQSSGSAAGADKKFRPTISEDRFGDRSRQTSQAVDFGSRFHR
jgi:hypothetical protein